MLQQSDIIVIGGGIIGLAITRKLCMSGLRVTLLEQSRTGRGASWAAAGMLAPHCEFDKPNPYFDLCRAGLNCYASFIKELKEETNSSIDYNTTGMIYTALNNKEQARLEDRYEQHYLRGIRVEKLSTREARRLEPNLSNKVHMALRYPADHQVENRDVISALTQSVKLHGGMIREGVTVQNIVFDLSLIHI